MPCLPRPTDVPGTVDIKDPELVDEKCVKHLLMAYPKLSFFQFANKCAFIGAPGSGKSAATIDFVRKNWGEYAKVKVAVFTPWDVATWTQYAIECNTKTGYNNVEIQCYFPNFDWVSWAVGADVVVIDDSDLQDMNMKRLLDVTRLIPVVITVQVRYFWDVLRK